MINDTHELEEIKVENVCIQQVRKETLLKSLFKLLYREVNILEHQRQVISKSRKLFKGESSIKSVPAKALARCEQSCSMTH